MGAPLGNQNAAKGKLFDGMLRRALAADDYEKARAIACNLVRSAEAGEQWAMVYLMDRIDGKPTQSTEVTGEDGGPVKHSIAVEFVNPIPRET